MRQLKRLFSLCSCLIIFASASKIDVFAYDNNNRVTGTMAIENSISYLDVSQSDFNAWTKNNIALPNGMNIDIGDVIKPKKDSGRADIWKSEPGYVSLWEVKPPSYFNGNTAQLPKARKCGIIELWIDK